MVTCREVAEHANDYVDGSLSLRQAMKVRMHTLMCKYCRGFVRQMQTVRQLVSGYGSAPPAPSTEDRLVEALRERRRAAATERDGLRPS